LNLFSDSLESLLPRLFSFSSLDSPVFSSGLHKGKGKRRLPDYTKEKSKEIDDEVRLGDKVF
jgi:hypothetical protein